MEVVLEMPFLFFNNPDMQFGIGELTWRMITTAKAISIIKKVKSIDKYKFVKVVLDENSETFVIYVVVLEVPTKIMIYLSQITQIAKVNLV